MSGNIVVRVSEKAMAAVRRLAADEQKSLSDAADALILGLAEKPGQLTDVARLAVSEYARERGVSRDEAINALLKMGGSRYRALRDYAATKS